MAVSPDPALLAETYKAPPGGLPTLTLTQLLAGGEPEVQASVPVTLGISPAIDFAQRKFIPSTTGSPLMVSGLSTLVQWCESALRTRRGECAAMPDDFGVDVLLTDLLGDTWDAGAAAEWRGVAERALLVEPLIAAVDDFYAEPLPGRKAGRVIYTLVLASEGLDPVRLATVL